MDSNAVTAIATVTGVGVQIVSAAIQGYGAFRRSNVEVYFGKLLDSGASLTEIGKREDLQRYLFSIMDKVSHEANLLKIEHWKNATIHLATDFKDFDFKDNFVRTLDDLTPFDLAVLQKVYSTEWSEDKHREGQLAQEVLAFFAKRGTSESLVRQALKRLAGHNLISERVDLRSVWSANGEPLLAPIPVVLNDLGPAFLRFVSEHFNAASAAAHCEPRS